MDKLEHYLDQVCRSIGGPRSLRQHVRQELREHLLDAAAQHKAAGLPEEEALNRALEDFGGPEEVRAELEATHGHRLLPVVIDRAMQWKERTMRAKWLWTTWAYLTAVLVIVLQVLFIAFNGLYILPKYHKLTRDGIFDLTILDRIGLTWMVDFLNGVSSAGRYTTQMLLATVAAWGLLEWRVKSENKPFIRLSVLGSASVLLMGVVILTTGSLVILFCLFIPPMGQMSRPWAIEQTTAIDTALAALDQALPKKDWATMAEQTGEALKAVNRLSSGAALSALTRQNEGLTVEELRSHVEAAREHLTHAQKAIGKQDEEGLKTALQSFQEAYKPVREAAKNAAQPSKNR